MYLICISFFEMLQRSPQGAGEFAVTSNFTSVARSLASNERSSSSSVVRARFARESARSARLVPFSRFAIFREMRVGGTATNLILANHNSLDK